MLSIYICDDEEAIRSIIERMIKNEILMQDYDMEIALSSPNPEEILRKAKESGRSNIYFLDVELRGAKLNGFEMGKKIRSFDTQGTIIYITAFGNLAYRTFEYHIGAMDYIVKDNPQNLQASLAGCLSEIVERLKVQEGRKQTHYFTIQFMDKMHHIPIEDIYYFETSARPHQVLLYAKTQQMAFTGKLSEIEKKLEGKFFRAHRAFLVNIAEIKELDFKKNLLLMNNGNECLVARGKKALLRNILNNVEVDR